MSNEPVTFVTTCQRADKLNSGDSFPNADIGSDRTMAISKLLIIEENRAVRTALRSILSSSQSIEVVATSRDIGQAHLHCGANGPDVILLGLKGSGNRDVQLTAREVAKLILTGIPVIVLASYSDDDERELLLKAGISRYLLKDINSSQLIDEIIAVTPAREL